MTDKELFKERKDEILTFSTIEEFYQNRYIIFATYKKRGKNDNGFLLVYRMYVYSKPFMTNNEKNSIWDWLNGYIDDFELARTYEISRRRNKRGDEKK